MGYVTTGDSVTGIHVAWAPAAAGDYDLTVVAGGTTGTLNAPNSDTVQRIDTVPIIATEASAISTPEVVISQS